MDCWQLFFAVRIRTPIFWILYACLGQCKNFLRFLAVTRLTGDGNAAKRETCIIVLRRIYISTHSILV